MDYSDYYANLIFQDHQSTDFNMLIKCPFDLVHPIPDIDPSHVKGRNGDFIQGNNSYQNVTETFNLMATLPPGMSRFDWERQVTSWLHPSDLDGDLRYQYVKFEPDYDYVFKAIIKDPQTFTEDPTDSNTITGTVSFYCEPFQYRIDGITYHDLPQSGVVYNTEGRPTAPDWHFKVKDNTTFTLTINEFPYEFDNMEGDFWVSGETGDVTDNNGNYFNTQVHFANLLPPVLDAGKNTITITTPDSGSIIQAEYKPLWRRLI